MTCDDQVWIQLDLEAPLDEYESLIALLIEFATANLLIVSGFVSEQSSRVLDHFCRREFLLERERRQGGWSSLLLRRV